MKRRVKHAVADSLSPQFRLLFGKKIALGPDEVELLRMIRETRSISEAVRRMRMSYMPAWLLIQKMNRSYRESLIVTKRGGRAYGGAFLTETGERLLVLYQRMEAECLAASQSTRAEIASLLKKTR